MVERGVDALRGRARGGERGEGVVDGVRAIEGDARGEVGVVDLGVEVVRDDGAQIGETVVGRGARLQQCHRFVAAAAEVEKLGAEELRIEIARDRFQASECLRVLAGATLDQREQRLGGELARLAIASAADEGLGERFGELRREEAARQRANGADRFLIGRESRLLDQAGGHAAKRLARRSVDEMR